MSVFSDLEKKWKRKKGLEGPYFYANGRVLYFDPKEKMYWDPLTDFFVEEDEVNYLYGLTLELLTR